ncbi:hypothetical protein TruAng_006754 [Truncatella angustata]|nr:hypothetical protein TruAng_006754 [Truncatella angustata]
MAAGNLTVEIHGSNESKSEFRTQDSAHEEVNAVSTQGVMEPYSVYDKRQKRILAAVLGVASLASPPIACIYLPLFPLLQTQYVSSAQTICLVFNDIGPVLGGLITWCTGSAAWVFAALMVLATWGVNVKSQEEASPRSDDANRTSPPRAVAHSSCVRNHFVQGCQAFKHTA